MGSTSFEQTIFGHPATPEGMNAAYQEAIDQALHEYGSDPYSGTIAANGEGAVLAPFARYGTPIQVSDLPDDAIADSLNNLSKYEPCEAVPIIETEPGKVHTSQVGNLTIQVPRDAFPDGPRDHSNLRDIVQPFALTAVRKLAKQHGQLDVEPMGEDGQTLLDTPDPRALQVSVNNARIAAPATTATTATKGPAQTRYFIIATDLPQLPRWKDGYASQAEARKHLPTTTHRHAWPQNVSATLRWEIVTMTRRASGEPLVTHTLGTKKSKTVPVTASVAVHKMLEAPKVTGRTGWLFCGMAPC